MIIGTASISFYGGNFSCLPPYLANTFGPQHMGAIHGRVLTALVYLNDGFDGGCTTFYAPNEDGTLRARGIVPRAGCVLAFPPGNTATAPHQDSHSVFIVQVHGAKRWCVHRPPSAWTLKALQRGKHGDVISPRAAPDLPPPSPSAPIAPPPGREPGPGDGPDAGLSAGPSRAGSPGCLVVAPGTSAR